MKIVKIIHISESHFKRDKFLRKEEGIVREALSFYQTRDERINTKWKYIWEEYAKEYKLDPDGRYEFDRNGNIIEIHPDETPF